MLSISETTETDSTGHLQRINSRLSPDRVPNSDSLGPTTFSLSCGEGRISQKPVARQKLRIYQAGEIGDLE